MAFDGQATYIYALKDPRNGAVRYVGKSNDPAQRLRYQRWKAKNQPSTHLDSWLRGLNAKGLKPEQKILDAVSTINWKAAEAAWMAELCLAGADLTNLVAGGEGPVFHREYSEAERNARSVAMKKRYEDPAERRKTAQATRRALAMASPEQKQRQSEIGKANYQTSLGRLLPKERSRNASKAAKSQHEDKLPDGRSKHAVMLGETTMSVSGRAAELGQKGGKARWHGMSKEQRSIEMRKISRMRHKGTSK